MYPALYHNHCHIYKCVTIYYAAYPKDLQGPIFIILIIIILMTVYEITKFT